MIGLRAEVRRCDVQVFSSALQQARSACIVAFMGSGNQCLSRGARKVPTVDMNGAPGSLLAKPRLNEKVNPFSNSSRSAFVGVARRQSWAANVLLVCACVDSTLRETRGLGSLRGPDGGAAAISGESAVTPQERVAVVRCDVLTFSYSATEVCETPM
jgi:hypothetical protein